uniref:Uncharacterized protein n=1 Tax=Rhizophora mucronata TaxID=61149 RepID=A0A2P2PFT3_RHIMU
MFKVINKFINTSPDSSYLKLPT